ncbi:MAG: 30S ribosomal protein S24e [Candidatus Bathyarchaeia archaeon]|nr:30S ribosomal protein S24e [Candidatus Bathyarchaeota archaeon]
MKFEVKIMDTKRNDLLRRNEVFFIVSHNGPTPSRIEIREKLANLLRIDVDRVYIVRMKTMTGARNTKGEAHIYDSPEQAKAIEPKHIIARNTPQKEEGEK